MPDTCTEDGKAALKVQLNMARSALRGTEESIDNCDPAAAAQRKYDAGKTQFEEYIEKKRIELDKELEIFDRTYALATRIKESGEPLRQYAAELRTKKEKLAKENEQLEYTIRSNRRRFVDGDPQDELPTVLGLKTSDDKVMFFFWSTYLLAVASVGALLSERAGFVNRNSKLTFIGLLMALAYGIAYWFIYKFA
jgi:hypothetical protein